MIFEDGHRFSTQIKLNSKSVSDFARLIGDLNPIHHDSKLARKSRYGGLIASGPQSSALLMGFTASYFSAYSPMVGLEFSVKFKSPVPADDQIVFEWMIVHSRESRKFGGLVIDM